MSLRLLLVSLVLVVFLRLRSLSVSVIVIHVSRTPIARPASSIISLLLLLAIIYSQNFTLFLNVIAQHTVAHLKQSLSNLGVSLAILLFRIEIHHKVNLHYNLQASILLHNKAR